jgi:DNA gyrase subunit B
VVNVYRKERKVPGNKELQQLSNILDMDLTSNDNDNLSHEYVLISTDADVDGSAIATQLIAFFYKYAPKFVRAGRVCRFKTPIAVVEDANEKVLDFVFEYQEIAEAARKYPKAHIAYKKGLGSMEAETWETLFKRYPLDKLIEPMVIESEEDVQELINWAIDDSAFKKAKIVNFLPNFNIDAV